MFEIVTADGSVALTTSSWSRAVTACDSTPGARIAELVF